MLQRSPTYIASLSTRDPVTGLLRRVLPKGVADGAVRWFHALANQAFYRISRRRPAFMRRLLLRGVTEQLPEGYDVGTHFTPHYEPWDQRVCVVPDGDLFKAISAGRVSVVTDHIETFTERGLLLKSGAELDADIIVTATGLELLFLGGIRLYVEGQAVDAHSRLTYKGTMLEDVPNLALAIGYTNASWTLKCDLTCDYICRLLNHMRSRGQRQCTPRNTDASVASTSLLGLSSGYIERGARLFPRQGSKPPWQVRQSYLSDYWTIKLAAIDDEVMEFTAGDRQESTTTADAS
jgi:cation diffusion facilitator CzcD-associated flavoprotein CzcO